MACFGTCLDFMRDLRDRRNGTWDPNNSIYNEEDFVGYEGKPPKEPHHTSNDIVIVLEISVSYEEESK